MYDIQYIGALVKDVFYREPRLLFHFYKWESISKKEETAKNLIFMVDGKINHGGLFDRFKGMITLYAIAKTKKMPFCIYHTYPFQLQKYLEPNLYDWKIEEADMVYSFPRSRPMIAYGEYKHPNRLTKPLKNSQRHVYYGYDSLREINKLFGTDYEWGELYNELFKPTEYLQMALQKCRVNIGKTYIAVQLRFMNLLGDKVETLGNIIVLENDKKEKLMKCCKDKILDLSKENKDCKILVSTDSNIFTEYIKDCPAIYTVPGNIKHMDTSKNVDEDEGLKVFLDYYMIAGAERVYSIVGGGLYPSAFPLYSAKIGNRPFERVNITI